MLEKLLGMEKDISERFIGLDKVDENLLSMLNNMDSGNNQNITAIRVELGNRLDDVEQKHLADNDSFRNETIILTQDISNIKTQNTSMYTRIDEMDAGNQQLLEKLLGVERELDGKLQSVSDNTSEIQTKLGSVDNENKNNAQNIISLQESIFIQTEQVKKVDAERQQSAAKAKEDFDANVDANTKAIEGLRKELGDSITKVEITLRQDQEKDRVSLDDKLIIVKKDMERAKGQLVEALVAKGEAMLEMKCQNKDKLLEIYTDIVKYTEPTDTKVGFF